MPTDQQDKKLFQLTNTLAAAIHAGQILLNRASAESDRSNLFDVGEMDDDALRNILQSGETLIRLPADTIQRWIQSEDNEAASLLQSMQAFSIPDRSELPVMRMHDFLSDALPDAPHVSIHAIANLCQLCLEMVRDGDLLQDLFQLYIHAGIEVDLKHLGMNVTPQSSIEYGDRLAAGSGDAPFDTSSTAYAIMLQKIAMWGEKNTGRRDKHTLAAELSADPGIQPLLSKIEKLPPKRIGILGHSMTMSLHWTTYGSWCDIALEAACKSNPGFEYKEFQTGGLTPSRAIKLHLDALLEYAPTEAYLLMILYNEADRESLDKITESLSKIGCKVHIVDDVRPWAYENMDREGTFGFIQSTCEKYDGEYLDFWHRYENASGWDTWRPFDGDVHMYTPGHLFYAKELLKFWASAPSNL